MPFPNSGTVPDFGQKSKAFLDFATIFEQNLA